MDAETEQVLATAQLVTEQLGQATNGMALYLTVTSGYLLVAYLAGKDLTRSQAAIVTVLYVTFAAFNILAIVAFFQSAFYFGDTYGEGRAPDWPIYSVATLFSFGILASMKFMWDVRHPKTE